MQPDIEALRTFLAVARAGGLTAAAEGLHRSIPALSRRLARLEAQLGAELLDRTTRPPTLTPMGRELLQRAGRPLQELDEALEALRDSAGSGRRELTVASIPTAAYHLVPRAARIFEETFPHLRLRVRDMAAGEVLDAVARGAVDLGISFAERLRPGLAFRPLLRDPFVLVVPPGHEFSGRRRVTWAELSQERLIGIGRASDNRVILDRGLAAAGIRPRWHHEVQHLSTALGFVEHGLGLAPVPSMALQTASGTRLVAVPLSGPRTVRAIGAVIREGDLDAIATAFLDHLRSVARAR